MKSILEKIEARNGENYFECFFTNMPNSIVLSNDEKKLIEDVIKLHKATGKSKSYYDAALNEVESSDTDDMLDEGKVVIGVNSEMTVSFEREV